MTWLGFIAIIGLVVYLLFYRRKLNEQGSVSLAGSEMTKESLTQTVAQDDETPLEEERRVLSPVDVPMIQARIEKLGILEALSANQKDKLRRKILELCQNRQEGLWWEPLHVFIKSVRSNKDLCVRIVDASDNRVPNLLELLDGISHIIRHSGMQLGKCLSEAGALLSRDAVLYDETYTVHYVFREQKGTLPFVVRDGKMDICSFVRGLNTKQKAFRSHSRMLVLAPDENTWCIVYCGLTEAERASASKWGQLYIDS